MTRHARLPLNPVAVAAANEALWAAHPELGRRQLTMGPADAALRREWMDAYLAAGGQVEPASPTPTPTPTPGPTPNPNPNPTPPPRPIDDPVQPCPNQPPAPTPTPPPTVSVTIDAAPCRLIPLGATRTYRAVGVPPGGTFQWSITGGHATIVGAANQQTVQVRGGTTSASLNDSTLKVVYTAAGGSAEATTQVTVVEVKKIKATIKSTPALTARAGQAAPANYQIESTRTAVAFPPADTLILMRGNMQDVALEAEVAPADCPVGWDAVRAGDDAAGLGALTPTVTPNGADRRQATLSTNETGSFSVRAFSDCSGTNTFGVDDAFVLLPVVLVRATFVADNSATHTAHINPTIGGGNFGLRTGSFNIANPATEAIHMNCTVDVVSGGPDGRRLIDRVFGGWINNISRNLDIRANYDGGHSRFSVFASNVASATGGGRTFLPADPAPILVAPPLLDTGRPGGGTGGETATLTSSRIRSRTPQALGQRWIVEAIDSPGNGTSLTHIAFGTRILTYHFELHFGAHLSFWANRSGAAGATGDPADRAYATLRSFEWDMLGEWSIDAANTITTTTPMAVTISNPQTHNPPDEADRAGCEVRPPTALNIFGSDGRS